MDKIKESEKHLTELKNLEKDLQKKERIGQTELEDLSRKINEAFDVFSEIGYLDKVVEVYHMASNISSTAAEKGENEEFRQRALMRAELYEEKANLEQASIGLRLDLMVTAETFRLSEEAQKAVEKGIEWLKQSRKSTGGWGWCPEKNFKHLGEGLKKELRRDLSLTRAWDTAMAIRALLTAEEKLDQQMISEAINWLEQNRNNDGGWGPFPPTYKGHRHIRSDSSTSDTSCVIIALFDAGKSSDFEPISKGVNWIMHNRIPWKDIRYPVWCDHTGQKTSRTAPPTPKATSLALIAVLKTRKRQLFYSLNFDSLLLRQPHGFRKAIGGGWGLAKYDGGFSRGAIVDTSYAIIALIEANMRNPVIQNGYNRLMLPLEKGIGWLKESQNADGGWGLTKTGKESEIEPTALAITALLRAGESSKDITIRNGVKWLLSKQRKDYWGSDTPLVILVLYDFIAKLL